MGNGSAAEVQAAMTAFMTKYLKDLLSHAPYAPTQQAEFRAWSKQFAHWLFGTATSPSGTRFPMTASIFGSSRLARVASCCYCYILRSTIQTIDR